MTRHSDTPRKTGAIEACQADFDEIAALRDSDSPEAAARELFAHAVLHADALLKREGRHGEERRVQRVLDTLAAEQDDANAPIPLAERSVSRFSWIAAAMLVFGLTIAFWPKSDMTPAWADALVDKALANTASVAHVYDLEMRMSFDHKKKSHLMRWHVALGSDKRFHAKLVDGDGLLEHGVEFGSDGKTLWARSKTAEDAFDLGMANPARIPWADLGPELAYYELRPYLEASHGNLELEVEEIRKVDDSTVVVLSGPYKRSSERRRYSRDRKTRKLIRKIETVETVGTVRLEVDKTSGKLLRTLQTYRRVEKPKTEDETSSKKRRYHRHRRPRLTSFDLRRATDATTPESAGFDFDPPRIRMQPGILLMSWIERLGRSGIEAMRRKRARQKLQDGKKDR